MHGSLASYDPETSTWKTSQLSLVEGLGTFSETWPRSGIMRGGTAFPQPPLAPLTGGTGSGLLPTPEASNTKATAMRSGGRSPRNFLAPLWPTPRASAGAGAGAGAGPNLQGGVNLQTAVKLWPTPHGFSADGRSNGPSGNELGRAVNRSLWPTPTATEGTRGNKPPRPWDTGVPLAQMVALYPTPRATDGTKGLRTPEGAAAEVARNKGPDLGAVVGGSLNPEWVEWLMGFPPNWTACMADGPKNPTRRE